MAMTLTSKTDWIPVFAGMTKIDLVPYFFSAAFSLVINAIFTETSS